MTGTIGLEFINSERWAVQRKFKKIIIKEYRYSLTATVTLETGHKNERESNDI